MGLVSGKGQRHNKEKNQVDLIPASFILAVGEVFTAGARKYAARNWENGMKWTTVYGCLLRHVLAWASPFHSDFDEETGLNHLWHAGCNIAMLIEFEKTCPELDDRVKYEHPLDGLAEEFENKATDSQQGVIND